MNHKAQKLSNSRNKFSVIDFNTNNMTIHELKHLKESEDKVEFKEAKKNFPWNGGSHTEQKDRRKCYLGYIVAIANEGGGYLVFGMSYKEPHEVVGSNFAEGKIGNLEDAVYSNLQIRVHVEELLDENGLRVLVTQIPPRPLGKTLKFEGVALMRTGESLRNMSDEEVFKILSEQEPDFSAKTCSGLTLGDLDKDAIDIFKDRYAVKQKNESFKSLSTEQALRDVKLINDSGITYATLILLGKEDAINKYLPNSQVNIEYRQTLAQTHFDKREVYTKPLYVAIDEIWDYLNLRNVDNKISEGPYKFDLPYFNEEVIRESVLNAIAHRDYSITSETVIKQYADRITILNPGGFPKGVTKENLINVSSTPRSRLLTEILEKTGLVERSGQGVDKIYLITLSEGKDWPDYSKTDFYQVELTINGVIKDNAFAAFINEAQSKRNEYDKLGAFDIIALYNIKEGNSIDESEHVKRLMETTLIVKSGNNYLLSKRYFEILKEIEGSDSDKIIEYISNNKPVRMGSIVKLFDNRLTRRQVNNIVYKLVESGTLIQGGEGKATNYSIGK